MWNRDDLKDQISWRIKELTPNGRRSVLWELLKEEAKSRVAFKDDVNVVLAKTDMPSSNVGFYRDSSLIYCFGHTMGEELAEDAAWKVFASIFEKRDRLLLGKSQ